MKKKLHPAQIKLYNLALTQGLNGLTLQAMADYAGLEYRQSVKHHLFQLEKAGLLDLASGKVNGRSKTSSFVDIPILGLADCGPAQKLAEENIRGYIKISVGFVGNRQKKFFAVQAVGNSMNRADVGGKEIENGDYLIIDPEVTSPNSGDYVLSVIDGAANIKRFYKDSEKIMLISESSDEFPPIVIHPDDYKSYMINGKVIDVIKNLN